MDAPGADGSAGGNMNSLAVANVHPESHKAKREKDYRAIRSNE